MIRAIVVVALLAGCAAPAEVAVTAEAVATPTREPAPSPTPRPTPANRLTPRPSSEPAAVDPELAFSVWKGVFADNAVDIFRDSSDAIEADFYWIDSVDRVNYDDPAHRLTLDITVGFESVYLNDPQEWRNDTWTLYRDLARHIWTPFIEGAEEGDGIPGVTYDWPRFIPAVLFNANGGRLAVECPGSLTYDIVQRQATQTEFESQCTFTP